MQEEKEDMFAGCKCPGCKKPFDYVPVSMKNCPFCNIKINSRAVWETRKYEGIIMFPGWVRAFGWPFLIILAGVGALLYPIYAYHYVELKLPALLISIGLVFFFVKLMTGGEY